MKFKKILDGYRNMLTSVSKRSETFEADKN